MNINDIKDITKTLGPEGSKTMGWGLLQKALLDTSDAKGVVNAKTLYNKVRKYDNIGVFNVLGDADLKQAVKGIKNIADGADEMVKQGAPTDLFQSLYAKIPSLLGSTPGRVLLTTIGSSNKNQTQVRKMITDLITGSLVIHKTEKEAAGSPSGE